MTTFEKVRDAVVSELGVDASEVMASSSFVSLGADSMDLAALIIQFEEVLGIEIPRDDERQLQTVQNVIDYANSRSLTQ